MQKLVRLQNSTDHPSQLLRRLPLLLLISSQAAWSCLPLSPNDVFIGRIQSIKALPIPSNPNSFDWQFSRHRFTFRTLPTKLIYRAPKTWQSDFEPKKVSAGDLIVGLAYNSSGKQPNDYTITTVAKLSCENDKLSIAKPIVPYLAWNRENGSCRHDNSDPKDILNGFFEEDHAYYLQKLQQKYPTCQHLEAAFPNQSANAPPSFWITVKSWFGQWLALI